MLGLGIVVVLVGPLTLLQNILVLNGHKAEGIRLSVGERISVSIGELGLKDQNKNLEIQGLSISFPFSAIGESLPQEMSIKAKRIHFVDETKPVESLKYFLSKFKDPAGEKDDSSATCLGRVEIESLEFGVSHSAELWRIDQVDLLRPCFSSFEIRFDYFNLKSEALILNENSLDFKINPNHFYDLETEKTLQFVKQGNLLKLTRPNLIDVNSQGQAYPK